LLLLLLLLLLLREVLIGSGRSKVYGVVHIIIFIESWVVQRRH
jgi:hypothetical protein